MVGARGAAHTIRYNQIIGGKKTAEMFCAPVVLGNKIKLTAAGWADVHYRQGWSDSWVGIGLDVAAPPWPPGGPRGLLKVRGEDAAAAAGAGRLLGRAEADRRSEAVNLRSPSPRKGLPP